MTLTARLSTCSFRGDFEAARALCESVDRFVTEEIEHWLIKLMETGDTDLTRLFRQYDVETARVHRELTRTLDQLRTGNARAPELSPRIVDLMREAWTVSSLDFDATHIRSGYLLTTSG